VAGGNRQPAGAHQRAVAGITIGGTEAVPAAFATALGGGAASHGAPDCGCNRCGATCGNGGNPTWEPGDGDAGGRWRTGASAGQGRSNLSGCGGAGDQLHWSGYELSEDGVGAAEQSVCTGSDHGGTAGGGLWTDEDGALRGADGSFSEVLFTLGPARQGTLLESIAVPELRVQAIALAELLAQRKNRAMTRYQSEARTVSGGGLLRMPEVVEQGA